MKFAMKWYKQPLIILLFAGFQSYLAHPYPDNASSYFSPASVVHGIKSVLSVSLSVCVCVSFCQCSHEWTVWHPVLTFGQEYWQGAYERRVNTQSFSYDMFWWTLILNMKCILSPPGDAFTLSKKMQSETKEMQACSGLSAGLEKGLELWVENTVKAYTGRARIALLPFWALFWTKNPLGMNH